jgi:hypothetical protein
MYKSWGTGTWALIGILLLGAGLRVAAVCSREFAHEGDSMAYVSMAESVLAGRGLIDHESNRAFYNAGYPLLVLVPAFVVSGGSILAAQMVNVLLGVVSITLCYLLGVAVSGRRSVGLLAAFGWACYAPSLVYTTYMAKENLMIPLMLGVALGAIRCKQRPSNSYAAIVGSLLAVLAVTASSGLTLALIVMLAIWLGGRTFGERARYACVVAGAFGVLLAPWLWRNAKVVGAPVLNTNGGFNLYLGNNPRATGDFMSIRETPLGDRWQEIRATGELKASLALRTEALEWIRRAPGAFVSLSLYKLRLFWQPPVHRGIGPEPRIEALLRNVWLVQFVVVCLLAVSTLLLPTNRSSEHWLIWGLLGIYTAAHAMFYVTPRYREPLMPFVVILASSSVGYLWDTYRRGARA